MWPLFLKFRQITAKFSGVRKFRYFTILVSLSGVIGDQQFGDLLYSVTGPKSHAFRKFRRHLYWAGKFKNMNPFALPSVMPDDPLQLALLALKKMSVDLENEISVWKVSRNNR